MKRSPRLLKKHVFRDFLVDLLHCNVCLWNSHFLPGLLNHQHQHHDDHHNDHHYNHQEVAAGQYLGTGGLTMVGQLVPMLQVTIIANIKMVMIVITITNVCHPNPGCWLRDNDNCVLARHLLLHHHLLDPLLPHHDLRTHTRASMAQLW